MAQDYIENQPVDKSGKKTHNNALDDEFKRWHLCHPRHNCYTKANDFVARALTSSILRLRLGERVKGNERIKSLCLRELALPPQ